MEFYNILRSDNHCCLHSGFSIYFLAYSLFFFLGFCTACTSSSSSSSSSYQSSSSPYSPSSPYASCLKQKQSALVQSLYSSPANPQVSCSSVFESNSIVKTESSCRSPLYLISSLITLVGIPSASSLVSTCSSRLEKQLVGDENLKRILRWLVLWSRISQVSSLAFEKQSTSTSLLTNPSFSKTTPQKSGMGLGAVLLGSPRQGSPSGRQSLLSTLLPRATWEICWKRGCFNNSYRSRMASISAFSCRLSSASCFFNAYIAFQVSSSPSSPAPAAFALICSSNCSSLQASSRSSSGCAAKMPSSSSSSWQSDSSSWFYSSEEGTFSFLLALPMCAIIIQTLICPAHLNGSLLLRRYLSFCGVIWV